MNKRLELQAKTRTSDGQGGYTEAWATSAIIFGSIEPVKAYEKYQAMQMETPVSHKIMTRYRSGVTTANRLIYDSRVFDIKEVINVNEDSAFLKITAIEKA